MIWNNLVRTLCYKQYCIEKTYIIFLLVPIFFLLFFIIYHNFIKFKSIEEKKSFRKRNKWLRLFILITRILIVFFILVAFAGPFTTEKKITHGNPIIKLLYDSSDSMGIFDSELVKKIEEKLKGDVPVESSQISSGKKSAIADGILRKIQGKDNLIIISDGNNHFGKSLIDAGLYAKMSDSRLFTLDISPIRNDAYVTILGAHETIQGTPNKFKVKVEYIGAEPSFILQIYVDEKLEFSGEKVFEKEIVKNFGEGYHKITAKIIIDDFFQDNNVFYKTVKVVAKPKVLFVSQGKSPMEDGLRGIYELYSRNKIPTDLKKYSAIVINDLPYSQLEPELEQLTEFALDGGGIFFIGGGNSFDKGSYKGTLLESFLPVNIGTGKIVDPLKHNIIIVLDVSESFSEFSFKEGGIDTALDLGKGLAVKMVDNFRDDISVGIVAFASLGQIVAEPVGLGENRPMLTDKIKRLGKGSGTAIEQGLYMAERALEQVKGTKNVILISDGKMGHFDEPRPPIAVAERMAQKGIRIYTVGIPSALYNVDINRHLMRKLAAIGNGNYFEPSEFQYLNVFFGKPEAKDKVFSGTSNLAIIDRDHFITKDLEINSRITGINFVIPKVGSKALVYSGDGNPVLNSWNFGLGRVITLATDDGRNWAGSLLKQENSMLITRIINYAVGNPEKDKEIAIHAEDSYLAEKNDILVKSKQYPSSKELTFTKEGENVYKAEFYPEKEGYYQFFDSLVAINSYREYFELGLNPQLKDMVELSGGKVLNPNEKELSSQIISLSERSETLRKDLKTYPLGAALAIFIIELIIRKIYEHKKYSVQK